MRRPHSQLPITCTLRSPTITWLRQPFHILICQGAEPIRDLNRKRVNHLLTLDPSLAIQVCQQFPNGLLTIDDSLTGQLHRATCQQVTATCQPVTAPCQLVTATGRPVTAPCRPATATPSASYSDFTGHSARPHGITAKLIEAHRRTRYPTTSHRTHLLSCRCKILLRRDN